MSIKVKYTLFVLVLHGLLVLVLYQVLKDNRWLFLGSEGLILFSLYLSYLLYKALIRPLDLMQTGIDAINDSDFSVKYLKTGSKEIDHLVEVFNTMIDQLRSERISMSAQSYFIQQLMKVSPIAILLLDADGKVNLANDFARRLFHLPEDYGQLNFHDLDHPLTEHLALLDLDESTVAIVNGKDRYKCRVTELIHQGLKRRFIVVDDLSSELLQSEKDAYGKIIRMMAHEVNNSMGAVNSILDTVKVISQDEELNPSLDIVIDRNNNLAAFMDNFASLLRLPKANLKLIDINLLLRKVGQLYIPKAQECDISIEFRLDASPIMVNGDAILLEQALSNILKNAIESIVKNGDIVIASNGRKFEIWDNGLGITEEEASKLFSPFYSTKPAGQGVGLMLIREILDGHGAKYRLFTDDDRWTKFVVEF